MPDVTSSNTGSAEAALNIVDYNVNVWGIREGQIRDYVYSDGTVHPATSGTWVRQTEATYVTNISGQLLNVSVLQPISLSGILVSGTFEITVDTSGDIMWIKEDAGGANSGTLVPARVRVVNLSGTEPVTVSLTSGTGPIRVVTLSGSVVDTSGNVLQLTSGAGPIRAVTLSGSIIDISGATIQLTSGTGPIRVVTLSGSVVDTSGATVSLTSGTSVLITSGTGPVQVTVLSGSITAIVTVSLSGANITANVSGQPVALASGSIITTASGSIVDISGNLVQLTSGGHVIASISGALLAFASGSVPLPVDISGGITRNLTTVNHTQVSNTALSGWVAVTTPMFFEGLTMHQSAAPTTSGNFTITITSISGAVFDTLVYSDGTLVQDLLYTPPIELVLVSGEGISVRYPNTDNKNIGMRITTKTA